MKKMHIPERRYYNQPSKPQFLNPPLANLNSRNIPDEIIPPNIIKCSAPPFENERIFNSYEFLNRSPPIDNESQIRNQFAKAPLNNPENNYYPALQPPNPVRNVVNSKPNHFDNPKKSNAKNDLEYSNNPVSIIQEEPQRSFNLPENNGGLNPTHNNTNLKSSAIAQVVNLPSNQKIKIPEKSYETGKDHANNQRNPPAEFRNKDSMKYQNVNKNPNSQNREEEVQKVNFAQRNNSKRLYEFKNFNAFEISKDLEMKISGFTEAFKYLDSNYVKRIVIENQGCTEDEIFLKLSVGIIHPQALPQTFNVNSFKTQPCPNKKECQTANCIFFHSLAEKRRFPISYSENLCQQYPNCVKGENCKFAHNITEILYHPTMFNKVDCPLSKCIWGNCCIFSHVKSDKSSLLEKLKAELENFTKIMQNNREFQEKINSDLESNKEIKKMLEKKIKCGECKINKIEIIKAGCGHCACSSCAIGSRCPVCGIDSRSLQPKTDSYLN